MNVGRSHVPRMPFVGEEDELANPAPVGLLGPHRIMLEAHDFPDLFAQP